MDQEKAINIEQNNDVAIVTFNIASISSVSDIERIAAQLRDFVDRSRPQRIIVDFTGVKFFSSQMLGLLVDIWKRLRDYDGLVAISGINPGLTRVFRITNLDKLFKFYPDLNSAVEGISKQP
jgi:anti-sigma B factor antagonist